MGGVLLSAVASKKLRQRNFLVGVVAFLFSLFAAVAYAAPSPGTASYGWYNQYDSTAGVFSAGDAICLYYQQKNAPTTSYPYKFVDHGNGTGECDQTVGTSTTKMVSVMYKPPTCPSSGTGTFGYLVGWETAAQVGTKDYTGPSSSPTDGQTYSDGTCAILYSVSSSTVSSCGSATTPAADGLYAVTCSFTGTYTGAVLVGGSKPGAADPGCPGTVSQVNGVAMCTAASGAGGASGTGVASGVTVVTGQGSVVAVKGPSTGQYGGDADIIGTDPGYTPGTMPSPVEGGDPFASLTGLLPDPANVTILFPSVSCPTATFDLFGQTYVMDAQCVLLAQYADAIGAVMLIAYSVTSFFIVLRA